jgi:hypothetical protein
MLIVIVLCLIAAFAGLAVIGHVVALQTIFTSADHADCRREARAPRSFLPDLPV